MGEVERTGVDLTQREETDTHVESKRTWRVPVEIGETPVPRLNRDTDVRSGRVGTSQFLPDRISSTTRHTRSTGGETRKVLEFPSLTRTFVKHRTLSEVERGRRVRGTTPNEIIPFSGHRNY